MFGKPVPGLLHVKIHWEWFVSCEYKRKEAKLNNSLVLSNTKNLNNVNVRYCTDNLGTELLQCYFYYSWFTTGHVLSFLCSFTLFSSALFQIIA